MDCLHCGHKNPADAVACSFCGKPLARGIPRPLFCPVCGQLNGRGARVCWSCAYEISRLAASAAPGGNATCPKCHAANLPRARRGPGFCIECGGALDAVALASTLAATPDPGTCPVCGQTAESVARIYQLRATSRPQRFAPPAPPLTDFLGPSTATVAPDQSDAMTDAASQAARIIVAAELAEAGAAGIALFSLAGVSALVESGIERLRQENSLYLARKAQWDRAFYCVGDDLVFIRHLDEIVFGPPNQLGELLDRFL